MTQQGNIYTADNGKMIVRKEDNFVMGESIDLGSDDNIKNYTEKAFTEESYREFYASIGVDIDAQKQAENGLKKRNKKGK